MVGLTPISDAVVRRGVRLLYFGSALLFLSTVALGIANVFMDTISRGQILAHFHAGAIGWVTLSVIATALWAFTGSRAVSDAYGSLVMLLAGLGVVSVAGYIFAFGLAFNGAAPYWMLPLFGVPAGLVIIAAFVLCAMQVRRVELLTTPHLLLLGALLVASLGALMGILVGIGHTLGRTTINIGAHAGPMDMYLALAFAAIVETFVAPARAWRWPGMVQASLGAASGVITSLALAFGAVFLAQVAFLLFLVAFGFYFVRAGWKAFRRPAAEPGVFWGGLAYPIYIVLYVYLVFTYYIPEIAPPHVLEVAFFHIAFVGMATNLILSVQASHLGRLEPVERWGIWVMNIGLLAFIAGEALAQRPDGALLMAVGLLMVLARLMPRMWREA